MAFNSGRIVPAPLCGDVSAEAELDDSGVLWVPRLGGRAPLSAELEQIARTGRWDRSRYPGRSEARMAVLSAAVVRGWRLAEVEALVSGSGRQPAGWRGLARLYDRTSEPGRLARLLPLEWRKAIGFATGRKICADGTQATLDHAPRPSWPC